MTLNHERARNNTHWSLLRGLQEHTRLSLAELGRRVGLSKLPTDECIRQMEEMGIIDGYHTHVNIKKIRFALTSFIQIDAGDE